MTGSFSGPAWTVSAAWLGVSAVTPVTRAAGTLALWPSRFSSVSKSDPRCGNRGKLVLEVAEEDSARPGPGQAAPTARGGRACRSESMSSLLSPRAARGRTRRGTHGRERGGPVTLREDGWAVRLLQEPARLFPGRAPRPSGGVGSKRARPIAVAAGGPGRWSAAALNSRCACWGAGANGPDRESEPSEQRSPRVVAWGWPRSP